MMDRILSRLLERGSADGQALSEELGVTQAAVSEQIERLRALGFGIEAEGHRGYVLTSCPDSLLAPMVRHNLQTAWAGRSIVYLPSVDSTNRLARTLAAQGAPHGTLVLADAQTAGRGRRGRSWISPAGKGIFMSVVLRPRVHPSQLARLSLRTALAVAMGLSDAVGLEMRIKWPNDIICGGKKVAGILLEMDADEERVYSVVAGIGINVHQRDFGELSQTASSLDLLTGRELSRAALVRAVLTAIEQVDAMTPEEEASAYRERSATIGQRVQVIGADRTFTGIAREVTPSGSLIVEEDGAKAVEVLSGDVSVRGLMGYV